MGHIRNHLADQPQLIQTEQPDKSLISQSNEWKSIEKYSGRFQKAIIPTENNIRIKEVRNDQLFTTLMYIWEKIGLNSDSIPRGQSLKTLETHIRNSYYAHNLEEIILAFDMAIEGKLDLEEKEVHHYQNFSCMYFSRIMNAYREYAREEYSQIKNKLPHYIPIENPINCSWEECLEKEFQYFLKNYKNEGAENWLQWETYPGQFYDILVRDEFMTPEDGYKSKLDGARVFLLQRLQRLYVATNMRTSEDDMVRGNKEKDIERKILDIREGRRDVEVILKAKQFLVFKYFCHAKKQGLKNLYIDQK